jgi:hypothetical protein
MENLPFSIKCNDGNLSQLGVHYTLRVRTEPFPLT